MKVMGDLTQREQNIERNSLQENTNWAAFGLDPITATVSNISPDAEAQPEADSSQDVEKTFSAWICVLGSFLTLIPTFGFMNSLGTVQTYLSMNQLHDYSEGEVGWISGLFLFLSLILNVQVGPMVDVHGPNIIGPIGAVLYVAMFLLIAECRNYWHFMLCLGVFGSIGAAMTMVVAIAVVGKLFVRKRGLAMGITLAGSSIGAVIFPIILRSTYPSLGWQWSMRIMAFISAGLLIPAILCFTTFNKIYKSSSTNGQPSPKSSTLNFTAFQSPAFCFVTAGIFMFEFVIFSISGLLPSISTRVGFTAENGYTLLSIVGAASTFGRVIPGIVGDKYGHFNVLLATLVFTIIFMGALLVPFGTKSATALYAWSAIWGFGSGSFLSITPVCMGMMNFVTAFALLIALPTSGAMLESMGPQALAGLFTGMTAVGGACYFAARALLIGKWLSPRTII
ncbi:monocarboxylate transporter 2 [Fusarium subglutinans]|uniref:Monocarboxylate transporter 2 n=1 Tax=Gibberella subglutinans TaxID=42677 RepID=A0A8H5KVV7_GIBSU|nr:monocarboxylate transporter 2 [Fusarium subglutinans]KAF5580232.1 monocarboxylate transporter 2 [Fusarium subglutinans]